MRKYKESDIRNIQDHFEMRGARAYIYTKNHNWFILHWVGVPCEVENYSCNLYTTTKQIPA